MTSKEGERENTIVGDSKHTELNTCDKKDTTSRREGVREIGTCSKHIHVGLDTCD